MDRIAGVMDEWEHKLEMRNGARFIEPYQMGFQCAVTVCIVVSSFLTCGVGFMEYLLDGLPNV